VVLTGVETDEASGLMRRNVRHACEDPSRERTKRSAGTRAAHCRRRSAGLAQTGASTTSPPRYRPPVASRRGAPPLERREASRGLTGSSTSVGRGRPEAPLWVRSITHGRGGVWRDAERGNQSVLTASPRLAPTAHPQSPRTIQQHAAGQRSRVPSRQEPVPHCGRADPRKPRRIFRLQKGRVVCIVLTTTSLRLYPTEREVDRCRGRSLRDRSSSCL